ncbi:MAG: hypothetical protein AAGI51_02470 [Pseudomonadota bacterium]
MKRAGWVLAAGLLAGCATEGGGVLVFDINPIGANDEAFVAARGTGQPVVVLGGDPEATAAQLRLPQRLGGGGFAAAAPGTTASRLVFSFAPLGPRAMCQGGQAGPGAGSGEASVAWCIQSRTLAYARGRGAALASPDAPGFGQAARRMTNAMLAPVRSRRGDNR